MTPYVARRATIVLGLVLAVGCLSCMTTVFTAGPPCPVWSEEAEADLARVIDSGQYPELESAIGRQELFCMAHEPKTGDEVCVGNWLSCWWRSLWL